MPTFAFGGVGDSGQGSYRGKASFDSFTHRRSVTTTPGWAEKLLDIRYPPYAGKLPWFRFTTERKPNFNRQGKQIKGAKYWLGMLLSLGGEGSKSVLVRWAVLATIAAGTRRGLDRNSLPSYLR